MADKIQAWIYAFRLRTLPLAFSSIITGSAVAFVLHRHSFSWIVFGLCILTTLLLQILSNLANDYGDSEKGTDNDSRIGPKRAVQAGLLNYSEIKAGMFVATLLSLVSGCALIYAAFQNFDWGYSSLFFLLGISAIAAAIKYTVGKTAYGYQGLGDVFVFLFFGIVGVCGSFFLQAKAIDYSLLLPSCSIGFLAAGVLNLNNMRDAVSDAAAGKNTLVVKIGVENAKLYHTLLIAGAYLAAFAFVVIHFTSTMQFLFILTIPLLRKHWATVQQVQNPVDFDPQLKVLAISTFLFAILFAAGWVIGAWG